jgi:REP element-mobilizing transposase RayT
VWERSDPPLDQAREGMTMGRRRRAEVIDEGTVGIFHITSRCVRQAFLCGEHVGDEKDYSHRRGWIEERVRFLASVFLIDILGFGVMSNHCHYILRNRPDLVSRLTDREIALRIWRLRYETDTLDPSQRRQRRRRAERRLAAIQAMSRDTKLIASHRQRLSSISWFMSSLNHRIACRANHEDGVTGRFWEGQISLPTAAQRGASAGRHGVRRLESDPRRVSRPSGGQYLHFRVPPGPCRPRPP